MDKLYDGESGLSIRTKINSNFTELEATKQSISEKNQPNGYAGLDGSGKIPDELIPALAISETYVVDTLEERDALTVQKGDVCIVLEENKTYVKSDSWIEVVTPMAPVQSVDGETGNVDLTNKYAYKDMSNVDEQDVAEKLDALGGMTGTVTFVDGNSVLNTIVFEHGLAKSWTKG